ncbi:hypothetical protein ACJ41O_009096 [Fusarium nematophilum]
MAVSCQGRSGRHALNTTKTLPISPDEITIRWLADSTGLDVTSFRIRETIPGTSTKILIDVIHEEESANQHSSTEACPATKAICIKGGFDKELFQLAMSSAYLREVHFFAEFGTMSKLRIPYMWHGATNPRQGQGIIIMEDLASKGCRFGDCTRPWEPSLVASVLEQLAALHALTWGATNDDYPWITNNPVHDVGAVMFGAEYWDSHFGTGQAPEGLPDYMRDRVRMYAAFKRLWSLERDTRLRCVLHGDAHIGNAYFEGEDDPALLDYQTSYIGSAMHDVAYWIGGSLTIENRRLHEHSLVDTYLEALLRNGGPKFHRHEIWEDYSRHMLHGFFWVITGTAMQTRERAHAMAGRFIAALEDLSTVRLLES